MSPQRQARAEKRKIHEEIAWEIHERIRRGDLGPGDRLPPERQLADTFQVSRGSVREALRALELAGVIRSRHGGGNFVADVLPGAVTRPLAQFLERHWQHLLDVSEARQMFEPRLAFLAAERATRADVQRLRRSVEEQEERLDAGDLEGAFEADRRFHQQVAAAARNGTFIMLHNYLSDLVAGGRREAIANETRRTQSPRDHRVICEAIAAGDGPAAGAAMLQHLQHAEASLRETLLAYQQAVGRLPGAAAAGGERLQAGEAGPSGARKQTRRRPARPSRGGPAGGRVGIA